MPNQPVRVSLTSDGAAVVQPITPQPVVVYPGDVGPVGPVGPAGPAGVEGTQWHVGHGPPTTFTPPPRVNDLYTDLDSSQVYEYQTSGWVLQGTLLAPVGTDVVVSDTEPSNPRIGTIWVQP